MSSKTLIVFTQQKKPALMTYDIVSELELPVV